MKAVYTMRFPAPIDYVEFTDDERNAILVSRARSLRDVIERHSAKLALVFHEEDAHILLVALEQFVNRMLELPVPPVTSPPDKASVA